MLTVKSTLSSDRVALWEKHPDHPDGEVFIAGDGEYQVAETVAVLAALKAGKLVRVEVAEIPGTTEEMDGEPGEGEQMPDSPLPPVKASRRGRR